MGGAEGYCNLLVCVSVCLSVNKNSQKTRSVRAPNEVLPASGHHNMKKNVGISVAILHCQVITIFVTHNCHFTAFRRLLVAKEYMEIQLMLFEGYSCRITAVLAAKTSSWL